MGTKRVLTQVEIDRLRTLLGMTEGSFATETVRASRADAWVRDRAAREARRG